MPDGSLLAQAEAAVDLSRHDPAGAEAAASAVLAEALTAGDGAAAATALRARGLARREQGDLEAARRLLVEAVETAGRTGATRAEALAHGSLASVIGSTGDLAGALDHLDLALALSHEADAALVGMQRGAVLQRLGQTDRALAAFAAALAAARADDDPVTEAMIRANRGILQAYGGAFAEAERDLRRAEQLFRGRGMLLFAADTRHNRGFVAGRRGAVVDALKLFGEARAMHAGLGVERPNGWLDECEVLLSVRLAPEARAAATTAERQLVDAGQLADAAEATLLRGRGCELDGDLEEAATAVESARIAFVGQGRRSWAALAAATALRVAVARHERPAPEDAWAVACALDAQGWPSEAAAASLLAAQVALEAGVPTVAGPALERACLGRRSPLLRDRVTGWHATALQRLAGGDRRGAMVAARHGVEAAMAAAATLGATEMRTSATGGGVAVAGLGLEVALAGGRAASVFAWAERGRAGSLSFPRVRPAAEGAMAADLARLRHATRGQEDAALAGEDVAAAVRRQAVAERSVIDQARLVPGQRNGAALSRPPRPQELADHLGDGVLVEFVEAGADLAAVVIRRRGAALLHLGPLDPVAREVRSLRFAMGRLLAARGAAGPTPAPSEAVLSAAVQRSSAWLGERLLGRLPGPEGSPLVIVPTGPLHALPWAALPQCQGRPSSVAPSARLWLAAARRPRRPLHRAVLIAGPGVPGANAEVDAVARCYAAPVVLRAAGATTARALRAFAGADLAHVAAHGHFRTDNPMFSSLVLADGVLTVYDLEGLPTVPEVVVLSACDVGRSEVRPGNEVLGVVSAFLGLGTRALVASVLPVPDVMASALSRGLHAAMAGGATPAAALASALPDGGGLIPFVCFGQG